MEDYLFNEVNQNFKKNGYLEPEEFFAIVIWKSPRTKTKVLKGINEKQVNIKQITKKLNECSLKEKITLLRYKKDVGGIKGSGIKGIGIPIASAILTVCYPTDFTVVDYRAKNSLENLGIKNLEKKIKGNPSENVDAYFDYLTICKEEALKRDLSLRDFDRTLFGKDIYEGEKGIKQLSKEIS